MVSKYHIYVSQLPAPVLLNSAASSKEMKTGWRQMVQGKK